MSQEGRKQLLKFAAVGAIGFAIDASVLTFLSVTLEQNVFFSRLVSFGLASFGTWLLNRLFTFKDVVAETTANSREYFRYVLVQTGGAITNMLVFTVLILLYSALKEVPVIPLAAGAVFGLIFNFTGSRCWVYVEDKGAGVG